MCNQEEDGGDEGGGVQELLHCPAPLATRVPLMLLQIPAEEQPPAGPGPGPGPGGPPGKPPPLWSSAAPSDHPALSLWSRETTPTSEANIDELSPRSACSRISDGSEDSPASSLFRSPCGSLDVEVGMPFELPDGERRELEDPGSPSSLVSRSHIDMWTDRNETLIIFDWDDTLCPTTHAQQRRRQRRRREEGGAEPGAGAAGEEEDEADIEDLKRLSKEVRQLLEAACSLGHVVIVTMAAKGWVEDTTQRLLPGLEGILDELRVPVVLAREDVPVAFKRQAFADCREPSQHLKRRAMQRVIQDFYAERPGSARRPRSWKNILSVGDSSAERNALQDLVFSRMQRDRCGGWKECRCKTVKLAQEPTLTQLIEQARDLARSLPALVHHDGDLDLDLDLDFNFDPDLDLDLDPAPPSGDGGPAARPVFGGCDAF